VIQMVALRDDYLRTLATMSQVRCQSICVDEEESLRGYYWEAAQG